VADAGAANAPHEGDNVEWLFIWLFFALLVGLLASSKGRSFLGWLLLAIIISPLLAGLLVLVIGHARRCPFCRGGVPRDALVCRHCGRNLVTGER